MEHNLINKKTLRSLKDIYFFDTQIYITVSLESLQKNLFHVETKQLSTHKFEKKCFEIFRPCDGELSMKADHIYWPTGQLVEPEKISKFFKNHFRVEAGNTIAHRMHI